MRFVISTWSAAIGLALLVAHQEDNVTFKTIQLQKSEKV